MVGNVGNIRSSLSSSHSPFTSDDQLFFFPMSTHSYSSSSSSSSILHSTSQIFSTNTPSLSTTTTTNTAAKPHIPNSLSLYNNNHFSSSSLVTSNATDSPILNGTIENEKKSNDRRITPSHIFASTNSFFSNEPTGD